MIDTTNKAVAIVGVGAILPDAPNAAAFWQNILGKRYSISDTPPERWSVADYYDPDPKVPDKTYSKIGGWVRGFEFDWKRFRMPPKVAGAMDQGQQWALTIAADALADYGYPDRPLDGDNTAVILGTAMGGELHYLTNARIIFPEYARALNSVTEFQQLPLEIRQLILARWHEVIDQSIPPITEDSMPGELPNIVSGRVANVLNLRGPNFITDAACASSFAAVEAAVQLLTEHKVDAVLTGGVDRNMGIGSFVKFCKIGALSATGTRPFGDGADGFVMGEGAAAFLLKRLADAEQAGDKIYAVIRGVGGASDGKGKGITAPNPIGQQLAMQRAWEQASLDPATAALIEAHGTSTRVGDVVEVESLSQIFGAAAPRSIALGSVKSNIGHLKAGAGAAGLLKATLALHHKIIPPTLNAAKPNPNIDFSRTPFYLAHEPREWTKSNGTPRRAAVSAYGFGGTNFHLALEEHLPGMLTPKKLFQGVTVSEPSAVSREQWAVSSPQPSLLSPHPSALTPLRGILALGAKTPTELKEKLDTLVPRVDGGWTPPLVLPNPVEIAAAERLIIDFGSHEELRDKVHKAQKAMAFDAPPAWKALQPQGIFRGSGRRPGKIAFLFPGQGSQYLNMGRELAEASPIVAAVFAEADQVMTPILGKPLTDYLFVTDESQKMAAEFALMQTAITQPAMLTLDTAIYKLLASYGFAPDMVMGHSLGEYAALIAAGIMPFADALEAAAARGSEMSKISVDDNGKMAAVLAPLELVEQTLKEVGGYVVTANINSRSQAVIGGATADVERACQVFTDKGFRAISLPVSHAFHTRIVAPASQPLRQVLNRLHITPGHIPLVGNVTGDFYPHEVEAIKDLLEQQIASPVQWVKGLETLYEAGGRTFVEVGPKKALKGFVDDVLGQKPDLVSLFTNHPKTGELASFNQAICGLYAAGYGAVNNEQFIVSSKQLPVERTDIMQPANGSAPVQEMAQLLAQLLTNNQHTNNQYTNTPFFDRAAPPHGSIVITGTGLGLPGAEKQVMDPENALRILRGEQFVDLIPERFRKRILAKRVTRLVKAEDGSGRFETITDPDEVIKLAGRPGRFDLSQEYGVPAKLVEALDSTTQLAMAAGLDALREAGIPLVQTFRKMSNGKYMPDRWLLPESLRDETGVIFSSAFPGGDRFADEFSRYYTYQNRLDQLNALVDLRRFTQDANTLREIDRRVADLRDALAREPYTFDRRFLFRILSMGHSQFAEYIGARGPNTQVNAACASTTQAIALAEDWIRSGRCRRVVVIGADNVTSDHMMEWVGAGFLATGAAATDDRVEEAALPFDRRRHGTLMGMGACALVLESEDAVRERGMRGVVELLATETNNSAFHGTRLDVSHIAQIMNNLVTTAERRFGLHRQAITSQMVFMSHETFTPARGGSAAAEVTALRHTFGDGASEIIMANTKGFTGHPMGVGIEDVIALKILEHGIVPPVPNHKEIDPDLGPLNLSRGGRYPVQYALHLAAGFGSQIAMTLTRRIPGALDRVDSPGQYQRWLDDVSGYDRAELEITKRNLRIKADGAPQRTPIASSWRYGTEPMVRVNGPGVGSGELLAVSREQLSVTSYPLPAFVPAPKPAVIEKPIAVEPVKPMPLPPAPEPVVSREPLVMNSGQLAASSEPPPVAAPQPLEQDDIQAKVMAIVAEQTGYPMDMLDLELDMEADLGIDTVKQAETFAAIRKAFDIPRRDDLKLRDYPTLRHVVGFVKEMRPDLNVATGGRRDAATEASGSLVVSREPSVVSSEQLAVSGEQSLTPHSSLLTPIQAQVMAIVAEQTGYPEDMLELDLDMEADLGIDTVKQAETFAAIRKAFDIPRRDDLKLRDYPTLRHVVGFVKEMRPDLDAATGERGDGATEASGPLVVSREPSAVSSEQSLTPHSSLLTPIQAQVMAIVAEQTGYPEDMLELDLDMEADLGIDTVKQAETFAAIRKAFDIPRRDDLKLRDYPTLRHVVGFVKEMRPELAVDSGQLAVSSEQSRSPHSSLLTPQSSNGKEVVAEEPARPFPVERPQPLNLALSNQLTRRGPMPVLRPQLPLCKPTGIILNDTSRVIIQPDQGGVAEALTAQLTAMGVTVLTLNGGDVEKTVQEWLAAAPVQGVYWLSALDPEPALSQIDQPTWQQLNQVRVKELYTTLRTLYPANPFLVTATRLGGQHGYGPTGAAAPLGGSVTGFTKAYKREKGSCLVKAVDFDAAAPEFIAQTLIGETVSDPGLVEVGYRQGSRWGISLREQPLDLDETPLARFDENSLFVVTGAAGGITSAIVSDLAAATGATFYLLDLAAAPDPADPHIPLFRQDKEALKQQLINEAKAAGEKPTPALIEKKIMAVERSEAALRAIESVQAAGGQAFYHSLDLRDGVAIAGVVNDIRHRFGRIDAFIHAAGVEISRTLPDKDPAQFNLVYDVKADGFYHLLHAAADLPISTTIVFSSVAGRFGNSGQTDYSAANDLLCKWTSYLNQSGQTRAIALDWTAWGGIGMATRGSIPKIMEMAGIEMLPPEVGIPTVRRELLYGRGEIVVAGKLGLMVEEFDPEGGLDRSKAAQWLAAQTSPYLMVGQINGAPLYGPIEAETILDPTQQPFLYDHALDGVPLLPGVMGTEMFAQLAQVMAPGYIVQAVTKVQFQRPFKFHRLRPQTLYLKMWLEPTADGELLAHGEMWSKLQPVKPGLPMQENCHFLADVHLHRNGAAAPKIEFTAPATRKLNIKQDAIYQIYFHGPAYQVLERAQVDGEMAVGLMAAKLPANTNPDAAADLMLPRLIELCFQTAGVWEIQTKQAMALPLAIGEVKAYSPTPNGQRLYALVQTNNGGQSFNAQVVDSEGKVYVQLSDYRTVQLPGSVSF
ncbi:MAG: SDR family NAD(P)-dependent oxidoreductase [Anaerolineae bacterium]|nr:SDR family NAD(P)-dependent oxidoreductase [Anaerolineae bacterium]